MFFHYKREHVKYYKLKLHILSQQKHKKKFYACTVSQKFNNTTLACQVQLQLYSVSHSVSPAANDQKMVQLFVP